MVTCTECRHENESGVQYCNECGAKLQATATVPAATVGDGPGRPEPARDASGTAAYPAKIVITRGGTLGREFPLEVEGETHIGRWDPDGGAFPEVDLTDDDVEAKISRKHARIFVREERYWLEDLGSLNGSFVNRGTRLMPGEPVALNTDDEIVLGKTFFRFTRADA